MKMLLEKIDKYIYESNLHDKVWNSITMPKIDLEDYITLDEDERELVFSSLDERVKEQIIKLKEGGLL